MAIYPGGVATDTDLLLALDNSHSTLAEALDASETGIDVVDGSVFAVDQVVTVDVEKMLITNIATNTLTVERGYNSVAATHLTGVAIRGLFVEDHHNLIKDEIIAIENSLMNFFDLNGFPNLIISSGADGDVAVTADGTGILTLTGTAELALRTGGGNDVTTNADIVPTTANALSLGADSSEFVTVHTKELKGNAAGNNLRIMSQNGGNIVLAPDNDTHVDSGDFYIDNSGNIFMNNSGSQILGVQDGTPIYSAEAVPGNGLGFTSGNGSPAMYIGGARAYLAANAGTAPDTSYEPMYYTNGGNNAIEHQQHTNAVTTSPKLISAIDHSAHSWLVWGKNGSARFLDRVYVLEGSTVMSAICVEEGSPAARTYTSAGQGGGLSLEMASGSYTVVVWGNHLE